MSRVLSGKATSNGRALRVLYNRGKCPAYCCTYARINVTRRDVTRLAARFDISYEDAERKYTKIVSGDRVLKHREDQVFKKACVFLDQEERRCTVYEARPAVCRGYPNSLRCGYYDFLASERRRQCDDEFIPDA